MTDQELREQAEVMLAYANAPEGKKPKMQVKNVSYDDWFAYGGDRPVLSDSVRYRLAPSPIAPGHNPDKLTVEKIPEGYRLMTEEEVCFRYDNIQQAKSSNEISLWTSDGKWSQESASGACNTITYCVPIDWKDPLLKKKVRKPCGPEHFPPGTVVKGTNWPEHTSSEVISRASKSISIVVGENSSISTVSYKDMLPGCMRDHFRRSLDGGKTWLPCYVEVEVEE